MISELSNIEKEDPKTINKMKDAKRHNFNKLVLICDDENYTTCLTRHKPRRATLRTVSAPAATLVRRRVLAGWPADSSGVPADRKMLWSVSMV